MTIRRLSPPSIITTLIINLYVLLVDAWIGNKVLLTGHPSFTHNGDDRAFDIGVPGPVKVKY